MSNYVASSINDMSGLCNVVHWANGMSNVQLSVVTIRRYSKCFIKSSVKLVLRRFFIF